MHSFDAPSGVTYHHNGDFSGTVAFYTDRGKRIELPFDDLKALVAKYVRNEKINHMANDPNTVYDDAEVTRLECVYTDDEIFGI